MDFGFSEEQEKFRQEVRDFLEEEERRGTFKPVPHAWTTGYNQEFTSKVAQKGWISIWLPKEYGGLGRSWVDHCILYEEMVRYGAPLAIHFHHADFGFAGTIVRQGSEEQKREILPKILRGEISETQCASEPMGSDLDGTLKTTAVLDGDEWVINGEKIWATHAPHSNILTVYAVTDPQAPKETRTNEFIVDPTTTGVTIRPLPMLSGHPDNLAMVYFDNVRVPKTNLIPGRRTAEAMRSMAADHAYLHRIMAIYCLWDAAIKFVKKTKRDGKLLSQDPLIRSKIAQIEIELEIGRLFNYRIAVSKDKGFDLFHSGEAMVLKAYGAEFEQHVARTVMEIVGLYGLLMPAPELGPVLEEAASAYHYAKSASLRSTPLEYLWCRAAMEGLGLPSYIDPPRRTI
jgi:alkylation response protein AidB-like acyl-CoA dehydrogenase